MTVIFPIDAAVIHNFVNSFAYEETEGIEGDRRPLCLPVEVAVSFAGRGEGEAAGRAGALAGLAVKALITVF